MPIMIVGTTQRILLNANPRRKRVVIQVQSSNVDANNTGITFVAPGHQPQSSVALPAAGLPLMQSDSIAEPKPGNTITERWKREIWAVSDTASQSLIVDEEVEDETPPTSP